MKLHDAQKAMKEWLESDSRDWMEGADRAWKLCDAVDDLLALNPLVPVPVGNRLLLRYAASEFVLSDDQHVYTKNEDGDWYSLTDRFQFLVEECDQFVQPVRLVPLSAMDPAEGGVE